MCQRASKNWPQGEQVGLGDVVRRCDVGDGSGGKLIRVDGDSDDVDGNAAFGLRLLRGDYFINEGKLVLSSERLAGDIISLFCPFDHRLFGSIELHKEMNVNTEIHDDLK